VHIVVHNCRTQHSTQQFDNIPTFPPDNHHSSDAVYGWRGGFAAVASRTPRRASSQLMTSERKPILLQLTAQQSVLIARPSIYWCSTHIFLHWPLTMAYDLDFEWPMIELGLWSIGRDSCKQRIKAVGLVFQTLECKQTKGRTPPTLLPSPLTRSLSNQIK